MADRYWVGGAGSWTQTTHWSTTSGGSSGASYPTSTDNAFFDGNSGAGSVNAINGACLNMDCTGYTGTITSSGGWTSIYGDLTLSSGGIYTAFTPKLLGSGSQSCTFASKTIATVYVEGDASNERTVTFNDAVTLSGNLLFNYGNGTTGGKAVTLKLKDGVTTTVGAFGMATSGPSSGRNTLCSTTAGTAATLSDFSGLNFVRYVNVADITASGGASWESVAESYDYGGNSGITGLIGPNANTLFFGDVA